MKKVYATYLLFLFVAFLSAPTIIQLIDRDANIGIVYSLAEEEKSENASCSIEFVIHSIFSLNINTVLEQNKLSTDCYEFIIKSYDLSVLSPPPDVVG
jgi:hypothetical protein